MSKAMYKCLATTVFKDPYIFPGQFVKRTMHVSKDQMSKLLYKCPKQVCPWVHTGAPGSKYPMFYSFLMTRNRMSDDLAIPHN